MLFTVRADTGAYAAVPVDARSGWTVIQWRTLHPITPPRLYRSCVDALAAAAAHAAADRVAASAPPSESVTPAASALAQCDVPAPLGEGVPNALATSTSASMPGGGPRTAARDRADR